MGKAELFGDYTVKPTGIGKFQAADIKNKKKKNGMHVCNRYFFFTIFRFLFSWKVFLFFIQTFLLSAARMS